MSHRIQPTPTEKEEIHTASPHLTTHGLSSDEAERRWLTHMSTLLGRKTVPMAAYVRRALIRPWSLATLMAGLLLEVAVVVAAVEEDPACIRLGMEGALVLLLGILDAFLSAWRTCRQARDVPDRLQYLLSRVEHHELSLTDLHRHLALPHSLSISRVPCRRDGRWVSVPHHVLVAGDLIRLDLGDRAPGNVRCVEPGNPNFSIARGTLYHHSDYPSKKRSLRASIASDISAGSQSNVSARFVVEETPLVSMLQGVLETFKRPTSRLEMALSITRAWMRGGALLLLFVSFAVGILRVTLNRESHDTSDVALSRQVYLLLPMLDVSFGGVVLLTEVIGNSVLFAYFDMLKEQGGPGSVPQKQATRYSQLPEEAGKRLHVNGVSTKNLLHRIVSVLKRKEPLFPITNRPLFSLGNTTVLCFVDKQGLLAESNQMVEKVLVQGKEAPIVLDISFSPSSPNMITFEDSNWKQHLPALKPLGLNILLNRDCDSWEAALQNEEKRKILSSLEKGVAIPARDKCLCLLAREIGFTDEAVSRFGRLGEIQLLAPLMEVNFGEDDRNVLSFPHTISVVVEERRSGSLQLLSKGNPVLLLEKTSTYWDGETIRPLSNDMKKRIVDQYSQWKYYNDMHLVAFSYKPIDRSQHPIISELGQEPLYLVEAHRWSHSVRGDKTRAETEGVKRMPIEPGEGELASPEREAVQEMLDGQIFIGMVALRHQPRKHTSGLVDNLSEAGIRFIHFSSQNDRKAKAFGDKLGLETDWNACISLKVRERPGGTPEGAFREKIPSGVENIRRHIEDVDNVPLLVSLFSNCTPLTTREMIRIFQENGEVVTCCGSSRNFDNIASFFQAEISVAIEPAAPRRCLRKASWDVRVTDDQNDTQEDATQPRASSLGREEEPDTTSPNLLSELSLLPCAFFLWRGASLYTLIHLIHEGRRMSKNVRQALLFVLVIDMILVCYLFLGNLLLLPTVLTGVQLVWILLVLEPLLSLSLLASPTQKGLLKQIPAKNVRPIGEVTQFLVRTSLQVLPTVVVTLIVFILAFSHFLEDLDLRDIFGLEELQSIRETASYASALSYTQNIALFFLVLYTVFLSMGFLHRTESIWVFRPYRNRVWLITAPVCILLQAVFGLIYTATAPAHVSLSSLPPSFFLVACIWPVALVGLSELIKRRARRMYLRVQKRRRLEFDTKLGMHSPRELS